MADIETLIRDLVTANRIIANEDVVDAYGHISVRHPTDPHKFLISQSCSPSMVTEADIMALNLDGSVPEGETRRPYLERFIHGAIYRVRPDVNAVLHSHAPEVLPYTVSDAPLRPVVLNGATIGANVPLWDISDHFGCSTNLLVVNDAMGSDLASTLGDNSVVLMRGHGFSAAARSLIEAIRIGVYIKLNAAVLSEALRLGNVKYIHDGEIAAINGFPPDSPDLRRAWNYWAKRAGRLD